MPPADMSLDKGVPSNEKTDTSLDLLKSAFAGMLSDTSLCDVVFTIGDQSRSAHRYSIQTSYRIVVLD